MKIESVEKVTDLKIITPDIFYDFRGEYVETFSAEHYAFHDRDGNKIEFVEDDISVSRQDVLRGLHGDDKTWKLIQCLWGEFYFVVVDMRVGSSTYLNWVAFVLNEKNRRQVLVPAGCANGHLCLSDRCVFSYKQSQYYSGSQKQFTLRWDDPQLDIYWPIHNPILSQRDSSAELLK
jgi:dTDP-4-dehydrorhamnose 3,5-epimerase